MNLTQAEQFRQEKRTELETIGKFTSDGCTFAPEIGTPCCEMHDFLRRYRPMDPDTGKPITPLQADNLLFMCILKKGRGIKAPLYWIAAPFYWLVPRLANLLGIYR